MKRTASISVLVASGLLAACSTNPLDKQLDYKSDTPKIKNSLEVPPDLTMPQIQNKYAIPGGGTASLTAYEQARQNSEGKATATTGSGGVLAPVDNVRMERAGSQRWMSVKKASPEELWPVLKAFWQDNGFVIKTEEPEVGILETDWAENRAKLPNDGLRKLMETVGLGSVYSTPERDKFRIRLEKTAEGTEVYFSHQGMEEVYISADKGETRWQPRKPDPELEAAFLGRFAVRLGVQADKAKQVVQTTPTQPTEARAAIHGNQLVLNDGFDRAWRRVGLALDRIGLVVTDRDRSRGTYYVRPAMNEVEAKNSGNSFWSTLAFWRSQTDKAAGSTGSSKDYQVQVKANGDERSELTLANANGSALPDALTKATLARLRDELK